MPVTNFQPQTRTCPLCGDAIVYTVYLNWWRAKKENRRCENCASLYREKTQFQNGHKIRLSDASKKKLRVSLKAAYTNKALVKKVSEAVKLAMHRPEVRKKHISALFHSKWLKVRTDKGQLELLEKWNRLGFQFEPNYQIKGDDFLYYLDGYDPVHGVVLEYDSAYHHRKISIKEKDEIRQRNIIKTLNPKCFWRYNSISKTWVNVKGNHDAQLAW